MPVHLFTFHAYRSWMPDRGSGYVRRDEGILARDEEMADLYVEHAKDHPTVLSAALQHSLVGEMLVASGHQRFHLHAGTSELSHVHALTSWKDERGWLAVRTRLKSSLSRRLTKESSGEHHLRLSEGASRKHVRNRDHFDFLMNDYLPKHSGVAWYEDERQWINRHS